MGSWHLDIFNSAVPAATQHRLVRMIIDNYKRADDLVTMNFQPPEAHDARGAVRRAFIEQDFRAIFNGHPTAVVDSAPSDSWGSHHVRVRVPHLILTESRATDPWRPLPAADYRDAYVDEYQLPLLDEFNPEALSTNNTVYGVVIHGPHPAAPSSPDFVYVVFPNPRDAGGAAYAARDNLLGKFEDLSKEVKDWVEAIVAPRTTVRRVDEGEHGAAGA